MRPKIVRVDIVDPLLRERNGPVMHVNEARALIGVKKGIWRIVKENGGNGVGKVEYIHIDKSQLVRLPATRVKVGWVQDTEVDFCGGAELSGKTMLVVGDWCGFELIVITPSSFDLDVIRNCGVLVLNNIWRFNSGQLLAIQHAIYEDRVPYVKYEHDHRELTRPEFSERLFRHAALNVFLSPSHLKNYETRIGVKGLALPLAIDESAYYPVPGIERKRGHALVCNVRPVRTWDRLMEYIKACPEMRFTVIANLGALRAPNVRFISRVSSEEMPRMYSEYEFFVHLQDEWTAGERVVLEAALCGCKVVTNDRVGHSSWGWDLADVAVLRKNLRTAPFLFWREIDRITRKI